VIVQIERGADGFRRVLEVSVMTSRRGESYRLQSVMRFDADPIGPDLRVSGRSVHYELPEIIARRLMLAGVDVPPAFRRAAREHAPEREAR
jgi:pilus assembly protein CpaF